VAVGKKGSGGAWGCVDQPECGAAAGLAGPAAPQNGRIRTLANEKSSEKVDRWAVGFKLVVLKMACSQSGCKVQWHSLFSVARTSNSRRLVLYLV
jgi:hypothetical protein